MGETKTDKKMHQKKLTSCIFTVYMYIYPNLFLKAVLHIMSEATGRYRHVQALCHTVSKYSEWYIIIVVTAVSFFFSFVS